MLPWSRLEILSREMPKLIGGKGLSVEVDESKFVRRKYGRSRLGEGQWAVAGICRKTETYF